MKKNITLLLAGMIISAVMFSQTKTTPETSSPSGEEIRTQDVVFKSQEQKDAKTFQVQERIKILETRLKETQDEIEQKKIQSQLQRCHKRLETLNNTKVIEPVPGRKPQASE